MARDKLPFEIPNHFPDPMRFVPPPGALLRIMTVPNIVMNTLMEAIGPEIPVNALVPFVYLRDGRLPAFVVNYFMEMQGPRRMANSTRFFRAMHLIEAVRESIIHPTEPGGGWVQSVEDVEPEDPEDDDDD